MIKSIWGLVRYTVVSSYLIEHFLTTTHQANYNNFETLLDPIYVFGSSNQGSDQTARMTQLYQAVNSVEVNFLDSILFCVSYSY
jgi:hypothetical protein